MEQQIDLDKYLIIVSKNHPLTPEKEEMLKEMFNYVPYKDEDGESCLEEETFKAYTALVKHMKRKYLIDVDARSTWRSIETQKKVMEELKEEYGEEWVKNYVALPGTSEHHTGLAFDLRFKCPVIPKPLRDKARKLSKKMGIYQKTFKIIEKEAVQFGLIKRYDDSKKEITGFNGELWHFRYVGVEHAKAMSEQGLCLEEYVKLLKDKSENKEKVSSR
jgi:D-alanyl-D-alanine carboxypeptidase